MGVLWDFCWVCRLLYLLPLLTLCSRFKPFSKFCFRSLGYLKATPACSPVVILVWVKNWRHAPHNRFILYSEEKFFGCITEGILIMDMSSKLLLVTDMSVGYCSNLYEIIIYGLKYGNNSMRATTWLTQRDERRSESLFVLQVFPLHCVSPAVARTAQWIRLLFYKRKVIGTVLCEAMCWNSFERAPKFMPTHSLSGWWFSGQFISNLSISTLEGKARRGPKVRRDL